MAQHDWINRPESNFTDAMIPEPQMTSFLQRGSTSIPEEHVAQLAHNYGVNTPDPKVGKLLTLFIEFQIDKIMKGCDQINCSSKRQLTLEKQGEDMKKVILKKEVEAVIQEIIRNDN